MKLRRLLKTLKKYKDLKTLGVALIALPEPTGISDIVGAALLATSMLSERRRREVLKWRTPIYARGYISRLKSEASNVRMKLLLSNFNVNPFNSLLYCNS